MVVQIGALHSHLPLLRSRVRRRRVYNVQNLLAVEEVYQQREIGQPKQSLGML